MNNNEKNFLSFIKKNPSLSRTKAYNEFRASGGKIQKKKALDIARDYANIEKQEFVGKSIRKIQIEVKQEIKSGGRKPKKGKSRITDKKGRFISKKKELELLDLSSKIKETSNIEVTPEELALMGSKSLKIEETSDTFGFSVRGDLEGDDILYGDRVVTLIDFDGNRHTFFGTWEKLIEKPEFLMLVNQLQQDVYDGIRLVLEDKGYENDEDIAEELGSLPFEFTVDKKVVKDGVTGEVKETIFDYSNVKPVGGSQLTQDEIKDGISRLE